MPSWLRVWRLVNHHYRRTSFPFVALLKQVGCNNNTVQWRVQGHRHYHRKRVLDACRASHSADSCTADCCTLLPPDARQCHGKNIRPF